MIAFIHIGKTGGQTFQSILAAEYGGKHCDVVPWEPLPHPAALVPFTAADARKLKVLYPSIQCLSGHHIMPFADLEKAFDNVTWVAFLRDPVKRMASAYRQMCRTIPDYMSFEDYCEIETHQNQQCRMLCGEPDAATALKIIEEKNIFVGLQESFQESLAMLAADILPAIDFRHIERNVSPNPAAARQLIETAASRELLEEYNQQDCQLYESIRDGRFADLKRKHHNLIETISDSTDHAPARLAQINRYHSKIKRRLVFLPAVGCYRAAKKLGLFSASVT